MKKLLFAILLLGPVWVHSQIQSYPGTSLTPASPESVGMSSERLARIDAIMEQAIQKQEIPGGVALVARKGKIVYQKAFGKADVAKNIDFQTDHIFRIASQTKAITSTAVMMLWEEGHFQLDDPISNWIPEFKNPQVLTQFHYQDTSFSAVPAKSEITIRHLLTHTSGIGYGAIDAEESFKLLYQKAGIREFSDVAPNTTAANIKRLAKLPLHFHPGEKFYYSMSIDVLGYFIEVVSGMSFDQFLQQRLFGPLGMNDTYFVLPKEKAQRLVPVQEPSSSGWTYMKSEGFYHPDYPVKGNIDLCSGGAGLSSTAKDYATFLQMYVNGGELNGHRILSRTTIRAIMGNQIGDFWGEAPDGYYGLAFEVLTSKGQDKGGLGSTGTFRWGGYFNSQYFADPQEEIIGVILKQTRNTSQDKTAWQFRQLVGQAVVAPVASSLEMGTPEQAGMSSQRLAHIDRICKEAIEKQQIPGAVALVARNGKIVYHKAFGMADNTTQRPMKKDDIFRIASQTKAITSTAVMMLWEEGHFRLDDPISNWIPEFKSPRVLTKYHYQDTSYSHVPAKREISIRHLLTHTSGIGYGQIDPHEGMKILYGREGISEIAPIGPLSTEENVKRIAKLPLHFHPGEKYQYGMGLDVLAHLVEILSGKPYETFLQERIFTPLGMQDTYFHLPKEKGNRLVAVQRPDNGKWEYQPVTVYDPKFPLNSDPNFCSGGGGLVSTATDYALFLQMYLNGGSLNGVQILSPTTVQSMMGNHIGDFWGEGGTYYGLAFGVLNEKGEAQGGQGSAGTFNWGGYFNTLYFADPKEKLIGILLKQTQGTWNDETGWQFRQLVGQAVDD